MPAEELWRWLRQETTAARCYSSQAQLLADVRQFQDRINQQPLEVANRLWRSVTLDPDVEKLRVSA